MSRKSSNTALNSGQDWIVDAGGIQILIEKIGRIVKNHIADRLQMFSNELEDLAHHPPDEQGYRLINGYRVREIFAGVAPDQKVFSKAEMSNVINLHGMRAQHGRDCYQHYLRLITTKHGAADSLRQTILKRWEAGHERLHASDQKAWERQRERFVADCDDRPYRLRGENLAKAQALGLPEEYNRLALMSVSVFHLSHWRLDVTVTNYVVG